MSDLDIFMEFLRNHPGSPYGLTPEKVRERGCLIEDDDRPDKIVVEVERHTGILGSVYRAGLPMGAFVTYWPRYVFDPDTEEFVEEEIEREPRAHVNEWRFVEQQMEMVEFHLEEKEEGTYRCREEIGNLTTTVDDLEEAKDFAEQVVRNWDTSFWEDELSEYMEDEEAEDTAARLREKSRESAQGKMERAWKYQIEEENEF